MKPERILMTIGSLSGGGAERALSVLANEFAGRGIEVCVCCLNDVEKPPVYRLEAGVEYHHFASYGYGKKHGMPWRMRALRGHIKRFRPDAAVGFLIYNSIQTQASSVGLGLPVIWRTANAPERETGSGFAKTWTRRLMPLAAGAVFQNDCQRDYYKPMLRAGSAVIMNPAERGELWDVPCDYGSKRITACGRFTEIKNFHMLLRAFSAVSGDFDGWKLDIYGEGEQRESLEKAIIQRGLAGKASVNGFTDKIHEKMLESSVFAMTSNVEGMPNSLIEAMCLGLACVTTDFDGGSARVLINSGENGIITPKGGDAAFSDALRRVMSDCELRKRLGGKAVEVRDKVSAPKIAGEWLSYIESAVLNYKRRKGARRVGNDL